MDLYETAKHLMRVHRIFPKRRLGQNFMVDEHLLWLMSSYAAVKRSDVVLEVGAGFGFLTRLLAQKARKVVAVEADTRILKVLRNELADIDNIELVEGNILKVTIPRFRKVVSNPPFSISSPLLFWLFNRTFDCAVLTLQKEFARRLDAPVGSKEYSRLTVSMFYRSEVELLDPVPRDAFYPTPAVEAVIVRLNPKKTPPFEVKDEKALDRVLRTLFTQRNRKVRNAILPLLRKHELQSTVSARRVDLQSLGDKRVRELTPEDFGALANELSA